MKWSSIWRFRILGSSLLILFMVCVVVAQETVGSDSTATSSFNESFQSPVNYKIRLSGSFGELRSNHFHTGIDIKGKNSTAGDTILSVMSGYISRIRVQHGSYGQCLYIDHPNGMTSVYAHLDKFSPEIERLVKEKQRATESFEIDYYLREDRLQVAQGDYIGDLGNTGRSYGPHLHFELRDTKTELALNPLYFDFGISDRKAPFISELLIHELDSNLNVSKKQFISTNQRVIKCKEPIVGIGFKGYDTMDGSSNYNGIADIKMYVDNKLVYGSVFDTISFEQFRYINACIDYEEKSKKNSTYYLCYRQANNQLSNLKGLRNDGLIAVKDTVNVKIVVKDLADNRTIKEFYLVNTNPGKPVLRPEIKMPTDINLRSSNVSVDIPKKCLYKPESLNFSYDTLSRNLVIGNPSIPCHSYYTVQVDKLPFNEKTKLFVKKNDQWINLGGYMNQDTFRCSVNRFGQFKLMEDYSEPTIKFLSDATSKLKFTVKDKHSTSGSAEDLFISVSLDGTWIPFYYKSLVNQLMIDKEELKGKILEIRVVDNAYNKQVLEYNLNN